jgi:hypothetical protein
LSDRKLKRESLSSSIVDVGWAVAGLWWLELLENNLLRPEDPVALLRRWSITGEVATSAMEGKGVEPEELEALLGKGM